MPNINHNRYGFSLVELMITLAVAAIILTVGVPNFNTFIANNRITAQANELISGLNLARSEALKRGQRVSVCSSITTNVPLACAGNTDWATGWIVFNDPDGDGVIAADADILRSWEAVTGNTNLTGTTNFVTYQGNGTANAIADFQMTIPNGSAQQTRRICIALAGNSWVNRPTSAC